MIVSDVWWDAERVKMALYRVSMWNVIVLLLSGLTLFGLSSKIMGTITLIMALMNFIIVYSYYKYEEEKEDEEMQRIDEIRNAV
jgi:L-asparagine transporter-like permease